MKVIDPFSSLSHDKILWCVYGNKSFPTLICCRLQMYHESHRCYLVLWGYSSVDPPAFRTLGITVDQNWLMKEKPKFFEDQENALKHLKKITTPKCDVNGVVKTKKEKITNYNVSRTLN